jgi:hypothetical protein
MNRSILKGLPGEEIIRQGLEDHDVGKKTPYSVAVLIASPRLREAGLLEITDEGTTDPEIDLYRLMQTEEEAYSRYRSLLKEVISFENALDHRIRGMQVRGGRSQPRNAAESRSGGSDRRQ